jgi:hypothetical protein
MVRCNVFIISLITTQALIVSAYWYLAGHEGYGEQVSADVRNVLHACVYFQLFTPQARLRGTTRVAKPR